MRIAGGASSKFVCVCAAEEDCDEEDEEIFCREVCAPECARVGVQRKMVDGHPVFGSQVTKFVELVNSPSVRGGVHHQEKFVREVVDEENLDTQADFCSQQNRVLTYWHEQHVCDCCVLIEFPRWSILLNI